MTSEQIAQVAQQTGFMNGYTQSSCLVAYVS
jgi:hypothetical protein